jgi:hypothetical protein
MKYLTSRAAQLLGVLGFAALLSGCGGGGADATNAASESTPAVTSAAPPVIPSAPPAATVSSAPQISGIAASSAKVGQSYSFQPSAKDANNDVLTFTISGAPSWLSFNPATGRITGTPTSADVGVDSAIVVQASNGTSSASLAPFSITVVAAGASAGNVTLSWQAPTENTNGTALANLSGYVIHYGSASKTYTSTVTINNPGLTSYVLEDLSPGTYYFSMTTLTTSGEQSSPSAEASTTIT